MTLVGPTARCQQRQNLAFTQRTARTLHPSREKERNIFSPFFFFFFFLFYLFLLLFLFLVSGFNKRCFLRSRRCSMEMWCLDDIRRDSWDWVGRLLGGEHASTPQSGVEAPRLLKRSLPRLYGCCCCVCCCCFGKCLMRVHIHNYMRVQDSEH